MSLKTVPKKVVTFVEDPAQDYYHPSANRSRLKSYETRWLHIPFVTKLRCASPAGGDSPRRYRRYSHDVKAKPRQFFINVKDTIAAILAQEDTDGDFQITIKDRGPKVLILGTAPSQGYNKYELRGTYALSNLLQELALAEQYHQAHIVLDEARLFENPVDRLSRMIRQTFWKGLIRCLDEEGLAKVCKDEKNRGKDQRPRIYVPQGDEWAWRYYSWLAEKRPEWGLDVQRLPADPEEIRSAQHLRKIHQRPGILALEMRHPDLRTSSGTSSGNREIQTSDLSECRPLPFLVPGGRFNELYGWDSYFEALGLLIDGGFELAKNMVEHFIYEISNYGQILNANRSYYLNRSQPPFLTDMALQVFSQWQLLEQDNKETRREWLKVAIRAAIKEYSQVWTASPRLDPESGLSTYGGSSHPGLVPPETEASHFLHVFQPYALARGLDVATFKQQYEAGMLSEPDLDDYFRHDAAVRESGHDTTYRLDAKCADLCTIDLNALLYKYEMDIAQTIRDYFDDDLDGHSSEAWLQRAKKRREALRRYCWNEQVGLFRDWDIRSKCQTPYESCTVFWLLWADCVDADLISPLVETALAKFEVLGGLVSGTEHSRGVISLDRPNRQWDYPFGWAPHQILAWYGLLRHGYETDARRLAYRWLYTITKSFVDFNGVVPEKFDVVALTHQVKVEYGNVGTTFKYIPKEGFGWMNASFQIGLSLLTTHMRRALGTVTAPETFFQVTPPPSSSSSSGGPSASASSSVGPAVGAVGAVGSVTTKATATVKKAKEEEECRYDPALCTKTIELNVLQSDEPFGGVVMNESDLSDASLL